MSRRYTIAASVVAADLARLGDEVPAGTVVKVARHRSAGSSGCFGVSSA
ncbi:MAG: hypothetical protein ACT4QB_20855 [Gammaproteobacteria bacterium]